MRVLLDTQCWLWWHLGSDRLSPEARDPLYLSAASYWEIAIKVRLA